MDRLSATARSGHPGAKLRQNGPPTGQVRQRRIEGWAVLVPPGLVAVGALALLPPIIAASEGIAAAVATNLVYPLGDLLILALLGGLVGVMGWRPRRAMG